MNKDLYVIILVNLVFLLAFIMVDWFVWQRISYDLESLSWQSGIQQIYRPTSPYSVIFRELIISGVYSDSAYSSFAAVSKLPNLPFLVFITAIITNIWLFYRRLEKA